MRAYLVFFLPWAFGLLHPGGAPLKMEWYLLAMSQAFQKTAIGLTRRLVINVPPRHLKSITAAAYAAWMLGRSPGLKIMIATYGDKLGRDHLERLQIIMRHAFYRCLFPGAQLLSMGIGQGLLKTTQGGGCRIVTVGGATTGFGADVIIIDDAMKAEDIASEARRAELDRFFTGTLLTRLNSKRRGVIISIQQRLGEDDLPGRLIEAGAEHLCLPAYDDQERLYDIGFGRRYRRPPGEVLRLDDEPMEVLERHRTEMGPREFATQYLQQPSALEGNIIRIDRFRRFALADFAKNDFKMLVQSWDTASSEEPRADYSVCLTLGYLAGDWYLLEVVRQRLSYPTLRDRVIAQQRLWGADKVLIEDAGAGSHLWADLRYHRAFRPIMIRPLADKITRMVGQLALIEDGRILIPHTAPWLDEFLHEMRSFPTSSKKDQVDSLSQFLDWAKRHDRQVRVERDPKTGRRLFVERRDNPRRR